MSLRFHWMLPKGGEVAMRTAAETARALATHSEAPAARPDMEGWTRFGHAAEAAGIESVLISFSFYEPDTLLAACAIGRATERLKFIAAYRTGLIQPTSFVQQINTLSLLIQGRIAVNIVAGSSDAEQRGYGDFLGHDERYARAEEFLSVCRALWRAEGAVDFDGTYYRVEGGLLHTPFYAGAEQGPEVYVSGHSPGAERLALSQASCWLRLVDSPERVRPFAERANEHGVELCLRLCVVCRETREAALEAAEALIPSEDIGKRERRILSTSNSETLQGALAAADGPGWLDHSIWAGLVPYYGSSAITLVGTPDELAETFLEFGRIGVTQFILSGWPKLDEMVGFGRHVIPRVRRAEAEAAAAPAQPTIP